MLRQLAAALCVLAGLAATAAAGGIEDLDAENGFRQVRFGEPIDAVSDLRLLSDRGAHGTEVYVRESEDLSLGEARLDGVTYGFWRGRLYFIALFTSGKANAEQALAELERAYGPGTPVSDEAPEFLWRGGRVTLHFRQDPATSLGTIGITSLPLDAEVKAARSTMPASIAGP